MKFLQHSIFLFLDNFWMIGVWKIYAIIIMIYYITVYSSVLYAIFKHYIFKFMRFNVFSFIYFVYTRNTHISPGKYFIWTSWRKIKNKMWKSNCNLIRKCEVFVPIRSASEDKRSLTKSAILVLCSSKVQGLNFTAQ